MKIFKWRLVGEDEYQNLLLSASQTRKINDVSIWFSGFKDLQLIWDYLSPDNLRTEQ